MDKDTIILAIVGISITSALLGYFAYLTFLSRKQQEPIQMYSMPQNYGLEKPEQLGGVVRTSEVSPRRPHIVNHQLNKAGKWYKIDLPKDMLSWTLKARGDNVLFYSFEPSHSTYATLSAGMHLSEDTMPNMEIRAIYLMCETANVTAEMEVWR